MKRMVRTVATIVLGIIVALHAATATLASSGEFVTGAAATIDARCISDQTDRAEWTAAQEYVGGEDQTSRDGSSCQDHCGWHIVAAANPCFPATALTGIHTAARFVPTGNLVSVPPPQ